MLLKIDVPDFYRLKRHFWQHALINRYKNNKIRGLYALFYKDEIIYIGQSHQIHHRILQHRQEQKKSFSHYVYKEMTCDKYKLSAAESVSIDYYRPKHNKVDKR